MRNLKLRFFLLLCVSLLTILTGISFAGHGSAEEPAEDSADAEPGTQWDQISAFAAEHRYGGARSDGRDGRRKEA